MPRASRPLKRVYMDFWGSYSKAKTLERYYLSLTDDCTRMSWIYLTKDREAATVKATLEQWLAPVEREKGVKLLVIRTDNAKEFKALEPWALKKGIQMWTRGHSVDYDAWAETVGGDRWSFKRMLPYFKKLQKHHGPAGSPKLYGFDGPISTMAGACKYPLREMMVKAMTAAGLTFNPDSNGGNPLGFGWYTENWRDG